MRKLQLFFNISDTHHVEIESLKGKIDSIFSPLQRGWSCLDTRETKEAVSDLSENDASFDISMWEEMLYL